LPDTRSCDRWSLVPPLALCSSPPQTQWCKKGAKADRQSVSWQLVCCKDLSCLCARTCVCVCMCACVFSAPKASKQGMCCVCGVFSHSVTACASRPLEQLEQAARASSSSRASRQQQQPAGTAASTNPVHAAPAQHHQPAQQHTAAAHTRQSPMVCKESSLCGPGLSSLV
jgi:hypothetical protein